MSDNDTQPPEQPSEPVQLPPQAAPNDTSNQENRPVIAPDGREHIKAPDPNSTVQK